MNFLEHRFTLDVRRDASKVCVRVRKGDTARRLRITLVQGVVPYEIRSDCYAMFSAVKPDGNRLFNPCTIEDNRIVYELTPQTTAVIGLVECEIRLYGADDALITSPGFDLIVDEVLYDESKVPQSETEVNALTGLISDAAEVIAEGRELIGEFGSALGQIEGVRDEAEAAAEAAVAAAESAKTTAGEVAKQVQVAQGAATTAENANKGLDQKVAAAESARQSAETAAAAAAEAESKAERALETALETEEQVLNAGSAAQSAANQAASDARTASMSASEAKQAAQNAESVRQAAVDAKERAEAAITSAEEATQDAAKATAAAEEMVRSVQEDRAAAETAARNAEQAANSINTQLAEELDERVTQTEKEIEELLGRPAGGTSPQNVKDVRSFGAVGDGTTDDTEAIAAAIAELDTGETLYFPAGVYRVRNIELKSNVTVQGDGWCSVIKLLDWTTDYKGRNNCLNIENVENIIIRDIKLDGNRSAQRSDGHAQDGRLDGLHIRYASDIFIENVWMYNNGYHGCIMTYATNVVFEHCKATDNGYRPIHGHTQIYNCRVSNCVCENNGLGGLQGSSGYENDAVYFFGVQDLVVSGNNIKSNRRSCITVGCDQDTTPATDIEPSRNITISGNTCECYEDLAYIPSEDSDTGVAKFSSKGILIYGGDYVLENVTVTGNTIKNAHEAIEFYAQEKNLCSINATVSGNAILDCSYGIYAVDVADVTVANNQFRNMAVAWLAAQRCSGWLVHGNSVNSAGNSEDFLCELRFCADIVIRDNNLIGDCKEAVYAPDSSTAVIVANNTMRGFSKMPPVTNPNGRVSGNVYVTSAGSETRVCVDPYESNGFVRPSLVNPGTATSYWHTTPTEITDDDTLYELNTYATIPNAYTDPYAYDQSGINTAIVFLAGTELTAAVGIANLSNGKGTVVYSENRNEGPKNSDWGVRISVTADRVKELFPTATHVMMQVQDEFKSPDNLSNAYHSLGDGHAYVYRMQAGESQITGDEEGGAPGASGADGATYTPAVDSDGNLTWTNDKGLPNPDPVNIRGPEGPQGDKGDPGQPGASYVLTDADKAEIADMAAELVEVPEGGGASGDGGSGVSDVVLVDMTVAEDADVIDIPVTAEMANIFNSCPELWFECEFRMPAADSANANGNVTISENAGSWDSIVYFKDLGLIPSNNASYNNPSRLLGIVYQTSQELMALYTLNVKNATTKGGTQYWSRQQSVAGRHVRFKGTHAIGAGTILKIIAKGVSA